MFAANESTLLLFGDINEDSCAKLYLAIDQVASTEPFRLAIHSPGGCALLGLAMYHELRRFKKLETRAIGECCSAALMLLQAGSLRSCTPYTEFMTHPVFAKNITLSVPDAVDFATHMVANGRQYAEILAKRTRRPLRFWLDFLKAERYFSAKEAKRIGLVDTIC